ncbi:AEC family transporter [Leucobacter denitrificans]|uniref:AEC family transporter n=1 Tax=Leucobacter denitrificans TaxID=683042 RepID=A0A7G9S6T6_9MICO|nr:AEC family transporter [Leucobacter denitrificans]QNN63561.1 AEC family transporter [Leucobacter denitrificans]
MLEVLAVIAPLFVLLGAGIAAGFSKKFQSAQAGINAFVFYFSLPAYIFVAVANAPMNDGVPLGFVGLVFGATTLVYIVAYVAILIQRKLSRSRGHRVIPGPFAVAATYGNAGYLGIPIVMSVYGPDAALGAAIGQLLHNVLFMVGYPLLKSFSSARGAGSEQRWRDIGGMLWRVFKRSILINPIVLSVVAGVLVSVLEVQVPEVMSMSIEMFGSAAVAAAMFAVGLTVKPAFEGMASGGVPIAAVLSASAIKLLVLPLATLGLALLLGGELGVLWIAIAVVMAAMPVSSTASIVVFEYDGDTRLVAAVTLVTSLVAIVTIPIIITII